MLESQFQEKMDLVNQYFEVFDEFHLYVIFRIENEQFGVEASQVQEVARYSEVMRLPRTPGYIQGLINFRGQMIPLLNLRKLFGGNSEIEPGGTAIIVVEANGNTFGMMADEIIDSKNLPQSGIHSTDDANSHVSRYPFQKAVFQGNETQIHLLDLSQIIAIEPTHNPRKESVATVQEMIRNTG